MKSTVRICFCTLIALGSSLFVYSQTDTIRINPVEIKSDRVPMLYSEAARVVSVITKAQISSMPVQTLDDVLKFALNVDVRQRGTFGTQSDVSIRGGSFEQTLILLNGVKINDPQTGHNTMNIPVNINDIERIEILEGSASGIFGPNAFSGAINIITVSPDKNNLKLSLSGGEHGYHSESAGLSYKIKKLNNYISLNQSGSDGYIRDTDFRTKNFLYQGNYSIKSFNSSLLLSYRDNAYGAYNFYSAMPPYQNEFEHTKTTFINLKFKNFNNTEHSALSTVHKIYWTVNLYWRTNQDKFELYRYLDDVPPGYKYIPPNYHLTSTPGFDINTYYVSKYGKSALGAEFRRENILSNVLGDKMSDTVRYNHLAWGFYDHFKSRDIVNLYAEHFAVINKFSLKAGLLANWTNEFKWGFFPGLDVSYQLNKSYKLFASANKSLRMPTFTDLYYNGPTNIGNPNLNPEEALSYEVGVKYFGTYFNSHISAFRRYGSDIIDWIKTSATDKKWQSMNLTKLTTDGIEFSADMLLYKLFNFKTNSIILNLTYSYINTTKSSGDLISLYALDYLRNKFSLNLHHSIINNLSASWSFAYFVRAGSYIAYPSESPNGISLPYEPYYLFDGKINYKISNFDFYLEASNIFNKKHIDINAVEMPGRWLKAGIIANFNL
jgi:vitamin B12 transporter